MGRGPECIASNGLVPGDVPVPSNHVRGYRHEHAPDRSGYAQSTGGHPCQWDVDGNWLAGVWDSDTAVLRRHGPRGKFCIHGVCSDVVDYDSLTNSESLGDAEILLKKL